MAGIDWFGVCVTAVSRDFDWLRAGVRVAFLVLPFPFSLRVFFFCGSRDGLPRVLDGRFGSIAVAWCRFSL